MYVKGCRIDGLLMSTNRRRDETQLQALHRDWKEMWGFELLLHPDTEIRQVMATRRCRSVEENFKRLLYTLEMPVRLPMVSWPG